MKKLEHYFVSSSEEDSDEDSFFDDNSDDSDGNDVYKPTIGNPESESANLIDIDLVNLLKYCK